MPDNKNLPSQKSHEYLSPVHAMHNLSYAHILNNEIDSEEQKEKELDEKKLDIGKLDIEKLEKQTTILKKVRIGVLALQGAFSEHCIAIYKCGAIPVEIRKEEDLKNLQGLILPGGESSVMIKLLCEEGLLEPLKTLCKTNIPILATCAGLILLAKEIQSHPNQARLELMDIVVERNAFGRQKESFIADLPLIKPLSIENSLLENSPVQDVHEQNSLKRENNLQGDSYIFPAVFIRAPQILSIKNNVHILAKKDDKILAVQQDNMVACSFHPELSADLLFHLWLVNEARK